MSNILVNYKERCNPLPLLSQSVKRQTRVIGEGKYRIRINEPEIKMSLVIRCDGSRADTIKSNQTQYYKGLSIRLLSRNTELKKDVCIRDRVEWGATPTYEFSESRNYSNVYKRQSKTSNGNETEQENKLLTD